jgi:hypothetical protein
MGRVTGELPLFVAQLPDEEDAVLRRELSPEVEIVPVGLRR